MTNKRKITKIKILHIIKKILSSIFIIFTLFTLSFYWSEYYSRSDYSPLANCNWNDSIGIITVYGQIDTLKSNEYVITSDEVVSLIELLDKEPQFDTIIILIDSAGGYAVAAEEIANALKESTKFTVAIIRELGTSAAYSVATGANLIYASESSRLAGIGVAMPYLDYSEHYEGQGIHFKDLTSARFKTVGDPRRPLNDEDELYLTSLLKRSHELMIQEIANNRNININQIENIADGKIIFGADALDYGLIDEIGGLREFVRKIGRDMEDTCEVHYPRYKY